MIRLSGDQPKKVQQKLFPKFDFEEALIEQKGRKQVEIPDGIDLQHWHKGTTISKKVAKTLVYEHVLEPQEKHLKPSQIDVSDQLREYFSWDTSEEHEFPITHDGLCNLSSKLFNCEDKLIRQDSIRQFSPFERKDKISAEELINALTQIQF